MHVSWLRVVLVVALGVSHASASLSVADAVELEGYASTTTAVMDQDGYAYLGLTSGTPASLVRLKIDTLEVVAKREVAGADGFVSSTISPDGKTAFFGTKAVPAGKATIVRVDLPAFTLTTAATGVPDVSEIGALAYDAKQQRVIGGSTDVGAVELLTWENVNAAAFAVDDTTLSGGAGSGGIVCAMEDQANSHVYLISAQNGPTSSVLYQLDTVGFATAAPPVDIGIAANTCVRVGRYGIVGTVGAPNAAIYAVDLFDTDAGKKQQVLREGTVGSIIHVVGTTRIVLTFTDGGAMEFELSGVDTAGGVTFEEVGGGELDLGTVDRPVLATGATSDTRRLLAASANNPTIATSITLALISLETILAILGGALAIVFIVGGTFLYVRKPRTSRVTGSDWTTVSVANTADEALLKRAEAEAAALAGGGGTSGGSAGSGDGGSSGDDGIGVRTSAEVMPHISANAAVEREIAEAKESAKAAKNSKGSGKASSARIAKGSVSKRVVAPSPKSTVSKTGGVTSRRVAPPGEPVATPPVPAATGGTSGRKASGTRKGSAPPAAGTSGRKPSRKGSVGERGGRKGTASGRTAPRTAGGARRPTATGAGSAPNSKGSRGAAPGHVRKGSKGSKGSKGGAGGKGAPPRLARKQSRSPPRSRPSADAPRARAGTGKASKSRSPPRGRAGGKSKSQSPSRGKSKSRSPPRGRPGRSKSRSPPRNGTAPRRLKQETAKIETARRNKKKLIDNVGHVSGYVEMQRNKETAWKAVFWNVEDGEIISYDDDSCSMPIGMITLASVQALEPLPEGKTNRRWVFLLDTGVGTTYCACESEEEMEEWLTALAKLCKGAAATRFSSAPVASSYRKAA